MEQASLHGEEPLNRTSRRWRRREDRSRGLMHNESPFEAVSDLLRRHYIFFTGSGRLGVLDVNPPHPTLRIRTPMGSPHTGIDYTGLHLGDDHTRH